MKLSQKSIFAILLTFALLAGQVSLAFAATVIKVSPSDISNDVDNVITVKGTDFDNTSQIRVNGYGLPTTFVDNETLTAVIPAKVDPGAYVVTVMMSSGPADGSATLNIYPPILVPPTATPTLPNFVRPQLVIKGYKANVSLVQADKEFKLYIGVANPGTADALNVQAAFSSTDLVPTKTGGVVVLGTIPFGGAGEAAQTFMAVDSLSGKSIVVVDVTLSYYDDKGTSYSDKFTLSIPAGGGSSGVAYPTATPTGVNSAQLVITSYAATVDPLEPGEHFDLGMTVQNMGNTSAKHVTLIVGGGSSGGSSGTPEPGGVSGGGGEFTNFAPVGASNIQSLGDLPAGGALQVKQSLIVNVSTNPGAYPMKITFSYVNDKGEVVNDDQVITLLVYSLPKVDISFYRDPGSLYAGQSNVLPLQVVNLGKRTAVLGNMTLKAEGGTFDSDTSLVGSLDAGGYFTFDASLTPDVAGPLQVTVTIDYTDDFNQSRTVTKTLNLTVEDAAVDPSLDPSLSGGDGVVVVPQEESFLQKAWRFILGLFGLDSSAPTNNPPVEIAPTEQPIIRPGGGGGGKG